MISSTTEDTQSITEVTDDPWEWFKFWTEVDENDQPYTPKES